mgnify:CR=1 FL=1
MKHYLILSVLLLLASGVRAQSRLMLRVKHEVLPEKVRSYLQADGLDGEQPFRAFIAKENRAYRKEASKSGVYLGDYWQVKVPNGIQEKVLMRRLNQEDWVEHAEPVPKYKLLSPTTYTPNDPALSLQWHIDACNFREAWGLSRGDKNITIGIIDSGIDYDHPDLDAHKYINEAEWNGIDGVDDDGNGYVDDKRGYNFGDNNTNVRDAYYHGTQVAGAAGAVTDNGVGVAGAAFNCTLLPVRVVNSGFQILNSFSGMLYAAEQGAKIINLSFGRSGTFLQWEQDVITYLALDKDVVIVAASGNAKGSGNPVEQDYYPASYKHVLSVTGLSESRSRISSYVVSTHIDIAAPGFRIETPSNRYKWPYVQYTYLTTAYTAAGTSFASPLAAGAAVLIRAKYPELNALQVAELIRVTTNDHYDVAANAPYENRMGSGMLDAFRALDERNTAVSVRVDEHFLLDGRTVIDDTTQEARLSVELLNYLNPTSGLSVTVSAESPYITMVDSTFMPGTVGTMQRTDNHNQPFRFQVDTRHLGGKGRFKFTFSDNSGYHDVQLVDIPLDASYLDVSMNDFALTFTDKGRIGYLDLNYVNGRGLRFRDELLMYEGGLFVGASPTKTADALAEDFNTNPRQLSDDFTADTTFFNPTLAHLEYQPNLRQLTANYTDTLHSDSLGLLVTERVRAYDNAGNNNYLIWEYEITNASARTYDSLRVGMFLDVSFTNADIAGWETARKLGYVRNADSSRVLAVQLYNESTLGVPMRFTAFRWEDASYPIQLQDADGFSEADKYALLDPDKSITGETAAGDVIAAAGVNLTNWAPGESRTVQFLIISGHNQHDIDRVFDNRWSGELSTDWYTSGNWEKGVPASGEDVVVPADVPHFPLIPSGTATVGDLEVATGASLTLNTGNLIAQKLLINDGALHGVAGTALHKIGNEIRGSGTAQVATFIAEDSLRLKAAFDVNTTLDLTQGHIDLYDQDLRLLTGATLPGISASRHIRTLGHGLFWQEVSGTPTVFPLAHADAYAPLSLSLSGTSLYGVRALDRVPAYESPASPATSDTLSTKAVNHSWVVEAATLSAPAPSLSASWTIAQQLTGFDPTQAAFFFADQPDTVRWESAAVGSPQGSDPYELSSSTSKNVFVVSIQEGARVSVSVSGSTTLEDSGNPLTFLLTRTGSLNTALEVRFSLSGTASRSNDFLVEGTGVAFDTGTGVGTLTLPVGTFSGEVRIRPTPDTTPEADETVTLTILP